MIAPLKARFLDLIWLEFGFARGEHLLMSAILTPGPQQNKSKLLDQVLDVIRQAGKIEEADRLSRELRERYPNYAGS